jgi:hypothetical protein
MQAPANTQFLDINCDATWAIPPTGSPDLALHVEAGGIVECLADVRLTVKAKVLSLSAWRRRPDSLGPFIRKGPVYSSQRYIELRTVGVVGSKVLMQGAFEINRRALRTNKDWSWQTRFVVRVTAKSQRSQRIYHNFDPVSQISLLRYR